MIEFPNANEVTPPIETVSSAPPTRSSFMATWDSVSGAKGYLLDVSTSNSFSSYVDGYHGLDVGNVNGRAVTGLNPGTTYYYRVRPYTAASSGGYSNVTTATTEAATGLIINPTFDCSIISDPNSAAIQAMINRAIAIYESLFSDPITIQILFRYSDYPCPAPEPSAPALFRQAFSHKSFRPLHRIMEQFRQRFESGCNNQQRQYSECQSAREPVICKHRAIQCERASGGIEHTAGHVPRRHHWTRADRLMESLRLIPRNRSRSPGLSSVAASTRSVRLSMKSMRLSVWDRTLTTYGRVHHRMKRSRARPTS